jgi:hypothetical protein
MQDSLFYSTEVIQRPNETSSWVSLDFFSNGWHVFTSDLQTEYALNLSQDVGFGWIQGEKNVRARLCFTCRLLLNSCQQMLNTFINDKAHVSVQWLISLVTKRGLSVRHLLVVKHDSTGRCIMPQSCPMDATSATAVCHPMLAFLADTTS